MPAPISNSEIKTSTTLPGTTSNFCNVLWQWHQQAGNVGEMGIQYFN